MWLCCKRSTIGWISQRAVVRQEERLRGRQCDLVVEEGCVVQRGVCTFGSRGYTHKYTLAMLLIDTQQRANTCNQTYMLC